MNREEFANKLYLIFEDRNLQPPSLNWVTTLFEKCSNSKNIEAGFEKIMSIPSEEWNKKYGFGGKPTITDWIDILSGERPLTKEELEKKSKEHQQKINFFVNNITIWLEDRNLDLMIVDAYQKEENNHLKEIIDKYAGIKEVLTCERIIKMAFWLRGKFQENKDKFISDLRGVASEQHPNPYLNSLNSTLTID